MERLLGSCDRSRAGLRYPHAAGRLGLRPAEVSRLELGDLDWRAGEIVVRGKGRSQDRLPLLADVGDAIAEYLFSHPRAGKRLGRIPS